MHMIYEMNINIIKIKNIKQVEYMFYNNFYKENKYFILDQMIKLEIIYRKKLVFYLHGMKKLIE